MIYIYLINRLLDDTSSVVYVFRVRLKLKAAHYGYLIVEQTKIQSLCRLPNFMKDRHLTITSLAQYLTPARVGRQNVKRALYIYERKQNYLHIFIQFHSSSFINIFTNCMAFVYSRTKQFVNFIFPRFLRCQAWLIFPCTVNFFDTFSVYLVFGVLHLDNHGVVFAFIFLIIDINQDKEERKKIRWLWEIEGLK